LIAGYPIKRLVEIKGRDLSPEELQREQEKDERFREKVTSINTRKMLARKQSFVTEELLSRYRFEVIKRVYKDNRPTLLVTFEAKNDPDSGGTIKDKLLNRLAGTLWIDEAEADTAKLKISLVEPLSVGWLGLLGSVTKCEFTLERQRMPEGVWINTRNSLQIHYRKLTATTHFRKTEHSSGIAKVE
jgi:hypothetical protein